LEKKKGKDEGKESWELGGVVAYCSTSTYSTITFILLSLEWARL
jgi:hypothetical protein